MSEHDHGTVADLIDWATSHPDVRGEATAPLTLEGVEVTVGITPRSLHTEWVPEANASAVYMLPQVRVSLGYKHEIRSNVDPARYQDVVDALVAEHRPGHVAALRGVERALRAQRAADVNLTLAQEASGDAIRAALAAGVTVAVLVDRTGLSESRIYQIRDRRR